MTPSQYHLKHGYKLPTLPRVGPVFPKVMHVLQKSLSIKILNDKYWVKRIILIFWCDWRRFKENRLVDLLSGKWGSKLRGWYHLDSRRNFSNVLRSSPSSPVSLPAACNVSPDKKNTWKKTLFEGIRHMSKCNCHILLCTTLEYFAEKHASNYKLSSFIADKHKR